MPPCVRPAIALPHRRWTQFIVGALLVLWVAILGGPTLAAADESRSRLGAFLKPAGYSAVPLQSHSGPHMEVTARINGVPGRFLLDTGAQITVINTGSLKRFHLSAVKTGVRVYGAVGGPGERIEAAMASRLQLGPCEFTPFLLGVSNLSALNQGRSNRHIGPFDGIIGADVLQSASFIIDCPSLTLYARPGDQTGGRGLSSGGLYAYLRPEGYSEIPLKRTSISDFEVQANVNGRRALWLVDTGAAVTLLDTSVSRRAGIKLKRTKYTVGGAGGGRQHIATGVVDILRLNSLQVRGAVIAVSDISTGVTGPQEPGKPPIDGYLGADFLRDRRAVIDCSQMRLYLRN